ncbi:MAG: hypothetical protein Q8Q41_02050 [bacterium]|nr:hypothetical protein [bacterium]
MANDSKVVVSYIGKPYKAHRSDPTISIPTLFRDWGLHFMVVNGVVTTPNEAEDLKRRDPKSVR